MSELEDLQSALGRVTDEEISFFEDLALKEEPSALRVEIQILLGVLRDAKKALAGYEEYLDDCAYDFHGEDT